MSRRHSSPLPHDFDEDWGSGSFLPLVVGVAAVVAVVSLWLWWADSFRSHVVGWFIATSLGLGWCLLVLAAGTTSVLHVMNRRRGGWLAVLVTLAMLAGLVSYGVTNSYQTRRHGYFLTSFTLEKATLPDFEQRPPLSQASGLLPRNQGDCVGQMRTVSYVADALGARWTGFVDGNGIARKAGCVVTWDGLGGERKDFEVCRFARPLRAIRGSLGNSLDRLVRHHMPAGTFFSEQDAYGNCEHGKAVLYLPLLKHSGLVHTHDLPGGLLVARSNDDLDYFDSVSAGQFPGPVYPLSLVAKQEAANRAHGSFLQHHSGTGGYETAGTSEAVKDPLDPNLDNQAQFVLRNATTRRAEYVTPLTPVGTGGQIIAGMRVEADHVTRGKLNQVRLSKFATENERPANATTAQNIRSAYATVLPWANANLEILEIVPGKNGLWNGTIGRKLELLYRFTVDADGASAVTNAVTGALIARASPNGQPVAPDGTTIGLNGPTTGQQSGSTVPPADLRQRSTDELLRLRNQVQAELDRRLTSRSSPSPARP